MNCPNCRKTFTPPAGATAATCPNCGAQVAVEGDAAAVDQVDYLDLELTVGPERLHLRGRIASGHAVLDVVQSWLRRLGGGATEQPELDAITARNRATNVKLRADLARADPDAGAPV